MNKNFVRLLTAVSALAVFAGAALGAALTNADIIKMVQANLDTGIIMTAVDNSEPKFDTSAQGLIELSSAKVPEAVVNAIIKRSAAPAAPSGNGVASAADAMSPSEILMIDGDKTAPMRYLNPQVRTAARGLGFGGIASYAVLRGTAATARTTNQSPSFVVSVPNQAQPESYMTLANFAVRQNNSREVLIGGGYMSYSTGIHPDRVIAVTSEKVPDQSRAQKGFTIYKVTPARKLQRGEYAVILYTGENQGMVGTWFSGTGNSYFDFGVDS